MQNTILLVSQDEGLQETRALILEQAGYHTLRAPHLAAATKMAARSQMVILGHCFTTKQQDDFVDLVHETYPNVFVLCMRFGLLAPKDLLKTCEACFNSLPGSSRICVAEGSNLISWPRAR